MNVLLIEPDVVLARTYGTALQARGCSVVACKTASGALSVLDQGNIDIIVLELQLAQHNGIELLHELRSYPEWDTIPVIVHSLLPHHHAEKGQQFWSDLGIATYLYKPQTSLSQLVQTVHRFAPQPAER